MTSPNAPPSAKAPGLLVAAIVAAFALLAAPHAGAPAVLLAIAFGAAVGNLLPGTARAALAPGLTLFTKNVLKGAIILLGLKFTADRARDLDLTLVLLIAICLVLALAAGAGLGRAFGVSRRVGVLLGCGSAICGATAIVTVAPLVEAKDDEVAFSIATIFLFNIAALFAFPAIGHELALTDTQFGAWVGTAVNDTAAVVATGKAWSEDAQLQATAVKLIRTLALVPIALLVAAMTVSARSERRVPLLSIFPFFVLGFAASAAIVYLVAIPPEVTRTLATVANAAIVGVLAAVGLNLRILQLFTGIRSVALGFAIASFMAAASLGLIYLLRVE